jgi:hypothetical protein
MVYGAINVRFISRSQRKWEQQKRNSNNNNGIPAAPNPNAHLVARSHFDELSRYFVAYLVRGVYLTAYDYDGVGIDVGCGGCGLQQFQELPTDMYDKLIRRKKNWSENKRLSPPLLRTLDRFLTHNHVMHVQSHSSPSATTSTQNEI